MHPVKLCPIAKGGCWRAGWVAEEAEGRVLVEGGREGGVGLHPGGVLEGQFKVFAWSYAVVELADFTALRCCVSGAVSFHISWCAQGIGNKGVWLTSLLGDRHVENAGSISEWCPATLCDFLVVEAVVWPDLTPSKGC